MIPTPMFSPSDDLGGGYPSFEQFQESISANQGTPEVPTDGQPDVPVVDEGNSTPDNNGEQPAAPLTQEELFHIKYNGEEKQLTKEEIIRNAQMGFDYTQKMQTFHNERKQWEQERQQLETQFSQNKEAIEFFSQLQNDPNLAQIIGQTLDGYFQNPNGFNAFSQNNQPQNFDISSHPEFQAVQNQLQEITRAKEMETVQTQWNDLTQKYPDAKDIQQELVNKAIELDQAGFKGNALEVAYFMVNGGNLRANAQKEVVEKSMAKQVAKTQVPQGSTGNVQTYEKPKTYEDIRKILASQNKNYEI